MAEVKLDHEGKEEVEVEVDDEVVGMLDEVGGGGRDDWKVISYRGESRGETMAK